MNLKDNYVKELRPKIQKDLGITNVMATPKLEKITVNVGIGTYIKKNKDYDDVIKHISLITGQKPVVTKSKKAISNFKLRIGMPVGVIATIRGKKMYDFMERLVNVVFPRIRDFRGFSTRAFDGSGNYSIGLRDFTIFPEINLDDVVHEHGLQITIITSAKTNEEGEALLQSFGFPFIKKQ